MYTWVALSQQPHQLNVFHVVWLLAVMSVVDAYNFPWTSCHVLLSTGLKGPHALIRRPLLRHPTFSVELPPAQTRGGEIAMMMVGRGVQGVGNAQSLRERAFDAARGGNPSLAADLFNEYLRQESSAATCDFAVLNCMGAMSAQLGRFEEAVSSFQKALAASAPEANLPAVRESRTNTFFNLGNACTALLRHREALAAFTQVTQLRPDDAEAFINMGNALATLGDMSKALGAYERAVAIDDTSEIALLNCGNALCDTGRNRLRYNRITLGVAVYCVVLQCVAVF